MLTSYNEVVNNEVKNMEKYFRHHLLKIQKFFNPHLLIVGDTYQNVIKLNVNLIRSAPDSSHAWHSALTINLKPGTILEFRGTVKNNRLMGDLDPKHLIFEIKRLLPDLNTEARDVINPNLGDLISLPPENRRDVIPSPKA